MKNQFVNFKIIARNNSGNKYRWGALAVFAIMMSFVIIYDEPIPRIITVTVVCLMLVLLLFLGIRLQLLDEHDEIGWLMIAAGYIVVKLTNDEIEYAIDNNTTLSVEIRGYAGEPIIGEWIGDKKGYGNFISLTSKAGTVKYEVLISNKMKILILDRLLGYLRRQGVVVKYNDKTFDDSKKSLILRLLLAIRHTR